jgi:hypothetical protein
MGRKDRKIVRKADDKEISKLMKTETFPNHRADAKTSKSRPTPMSSATRKPRTRK